MRSRKENVLINLLLGGGIYLLDSLRRRLPDVDEMSERARHEYDDLRDKASGAFDRASGRAANVICGKDNRTSSPAALLLGVGLGAGLGLLFAPASGDNTRRQIKEKIRDNFSCEKSPATAT